MKCYRPTCTAEAAEGKPLCPPCDGALAVTPGASRRISAAEREAPELLAVARLFLGFLEADGTECCCDDGDPCALCRVQGVLDRVDGKPTTTRKKAPNGRVVTILDLPGDDAVPDG